MALLQYEEMEYIDCNIDEKQPERFPPPLGKALLL